MIRKSWLALLGLALIGAGVPEARAETLRFDLKNRDGIPFLIQIPRGTGTFFDLIPAQALCHWAVESTTLVSLAAGWPGTSDLFYEGNLVVRDGKRLRSLGRAFDQKDGIDDPSGGLMGFALTESGIREWIKYANSKTLSEGRTLGESERILAEALLGFGLVRRGSEGFELTPAAHAVRPVQLTFSLFSPTVIRHELMHKVVEKYGLSDRLEAKLRERVLRSPEFRRELEKYAESKREDGYADMSLEPLDGEGFSLLVDEWFADQAENPEALEAAAGTTYLPCGPMASIDHGFEARRKLIERMFLSTPPSSR